MGWPAVPNHPALPVVGREADAWSGGDRELDDVSPVSGSKEIWTGAWRRAASPIIP
jgi:hypothetical protein